MEPAPMRDKGVQNRALIVDTANRLFYEKGFNRTSFNEIADASGVPKGNFYYYFRSKDEILKAVVDARMERIRNMLAQWDEEFASPRERIARYVQILPNSEKELLRFGCPMGTLNVELAKSQADLQAHAAEMLALFQEWLVRQFAELGYDRAQARSLALHLLARSQGIALIANAFNDPAFLHEEVRLLEEWLATVAVPQQARPQS